MPESTSLVRNEDRPPEMAALRARALDRRRELAQSLQQLEAAVVRANPLPDVKAETASNPYRTVGLAFLVGMVLGAL